MSTQTTHSVVSLPYLLVECHQVQLAIIPHIPVAVMLFAYIKCAQSVISILSLETFGVAVLEYQVPLVEAGDCPCLHCIAGLVLSGC